MKVGAAIGLLIAGLAWGAIGPRLAAARPAHATVRSVEVDGTRFRITLSDGSVLPQQELPGLVLQVGDGSGQRRRIRIDAAEPDPKDPAGEVILYTLSEQVADASWQNICRPDPDGRRMGFPLEGAFTAGGRYVPSPGKLLITCTGGAEGKCVRFGYKPWSHAPDGTALLAYYQACVRLVRADYCGDGVGHTRNGMPIDLFDRIGIQADEPAPGMTLEAVWSPEGAVCVRHTRLPMPGGVDALANICPRLANHLGAACDETAPGLLFLRSFDPAG